MAHNPHHLTRTFPLQQKSATPTGAALYMYRNTEFGVVQSTGLQCWNAKLQTGCINKSVTLQRKSNRGFAAIKNNNMSKTFKIEVDCANCANLVEEAAQKVEGVKELSISFMTQKMKVTFEENADQNAVMAKVLKVAKKVEPDFEIL